MKEKHTSSYDDTKEDIKKEGSNDGYIIKANKELAVLRDQTKRNYVVCGLGNKYRNSEASGPFIVKCTS